jgi:hypothetical protein
MYTPHTYPIALFMMLASMLCWGSWANTQKIDKAWRFNLFYWDYMWGVLVCALLFGLTMGRTNPAAPVSFFHNLGGASARSLVETFVGGVIFNLGNLLLVRALLAGPIAGVASVGYVRAVTWADRNKPQGWRRLAAPFLGLGLLGVVSISFPQLLGNGKDVSQLAFTNQVAPVLLLMLCALKPAATVLCVRSGAPGGLFTPSLTVGVLLGGVLGHVWSWFWPGAPPRTVRRARRGGGSCSHYTRPDLDRGTDDGTDGPGPILYRAAVAGCGRRYFRGADHRASLGSAWLRILAPVFG